MTSPVVGTVGSYGHQFSRLLTAALEREESELKAARSTARNKEQSVHSVSQYYESWLSVPLLKEAIRNPACPQLSWEEGRVDLSFLEKGHTVATFELKPFFPVRQSNRTALYRVVADFRKQYEEHRADSTIERYVVLAPWGDLEGIRKWTDELMTRVRAELQDILVEEVPASKPVKLNRAGDAYLLVEVFRVTAAAR